MKNKTFRLDKPYQPLIIVVLLLFSASMACNLPGSEATNEVDDVGIETAVAQTMAAKEVEEPQPVEDGDTPAASSPTETPAPSSTFTLTPTVTNTPTPGPTDTPTQTPTNTLTPTPEVPLVEVSVSTNCRQGPGKVYDRLGVLTKGEKAEIIAKDPYDIYWYIRNPDKSGGFCWLWGHYASTVGDTESLPVYTPEPTPTLALGFSVSFQEVEVCGNWYIEFYIVNTGGFTLQSVTTTVTDNNTAQTVTYTHDSFVGGDGCSVSSDQQDLVAGEAGNTLSHYLSNNPAGHNLSAAITICTENGLGGTCVTRNLTFTP